MHMSSDRRPSSCPHQTLEPRVSDLISVLAMDLINVAVKPSRQADGSMKNEQAVALSSKNMKLSELNLVWDNILK